MSSIHDDDTCPHLVRASLLEAENARLKTEVEHLMIFCNCTLIPNKELQDENARLQAEAERLRNLATKIDAYVDVLVLENGLLRKAGDELERVLTSRSGSYEAGNASHEWQSAKNYKPKA